MAGDWVKINKSLLRDPRIVRIASALKEDRLRTLGGTLSVFCLFDEQTENGKLIGYTPEVLDEMIPFTGLTRAMESVGWMIVGEGFLEMPRFGEHNGQSAKRRAQDRDRKSSDRKADKRPVEKQTKSGTEIEVENIEESLSPLPPPGDYESEGDIELIQKIRSIHPQWSGNPSLSTKEREAFTAGREQLIGFTAEDWETQRDFLHTKLREGDAAEQVKVLHVYLENPNRTLGVARHWKSKHRPKTLQPPRGVPPSSEALSKEEVAEMLNLAPLNGRQPEKVRNSPGEPLTTR